MGSVKITEGPYRPRVEINGELIDFVDDPEVDYSGPVALVRITLRPDTLEVSHGIDGPETD